MKLFAALCLVFMLGCNTVSDMAITHVEAATAVPNASGTYSGHLVHQPEFPPIDFDITISISQSGSGDIQQLTGTVTRQATICWDATPVPVKGFFVVTRDDKGNILSRRITLEETAQINITLQAFPGDDLKTARFAYGSILPNNHPCQAVQAIGDLSR